MASTSRDRASPFLIGLKFSTPDQRIPICVRCLFHPPVSDSCLVVCGSKHHSRPLRSAPLPPLSAMRGQKGKGKGKRTSFSPLKFSESSWPDSGIMATPPLIDVASNSVNVIGESSKRGEEDSLLGFASIEQSGPDSGVYIIYLCSDFWANYLNGTIPKEWASTKLEVLSLENNMFNRQVPASLGKLVNLVVLVLNTNNLTGSIPAELSHLPKLKEIKGLRGLHGL
ncbi:hypothetical protein OROHE_006290 [Orobanche hederae]